MYIRAASLIALPAALALGASAALAQPPAPASAGPNAVQQEMRLLTAAMNTIVLAIANNDLQAIPPALHRVHGAREQTEQAIHSGAYRLKDPSRLQAFLEEDEAFHDELVKLLRASRANDLEAATRQVGVIMNGCTSCHVKFRF